jgi:hypothetical protein
MIERRKNRRFDLKLPVEVVLASADRKSSGETRNLSSSGVLFSSEVSFEIGEPIEYLITFPRASRSRTEVRLRCSGKVLRNEAGSLAATLENYQFSRRLRARRPGSALPNGSIELDRR